MNDFGPTLGDLLGWVQTGHLGPDAALGVNRDPQFDAHAELVARVFNTNDGRAVLELLADATVRRPAVDHRLGVGADYAAYAQLRQGQNQVFALILTYLDHAKEMEKQRGSQQRTIDFDAPAWGSADQTADRRSAPDEFDGAGTIGIG